MPYNGSPGAARIERNPLDPSTAYGELPSSRLGACASPPPVCAFQIQLSSIGAVPMQSLSATASTAATPTDTRARLM